MKTYFARDYGVLPNREVGAELNALIKKLAEDGEEKTLVFDAGEYRIDAEHCPHELLYVTNTSEETDWDAGQTPHLCAVAFYFCGVKDLSVQGNGATFLITGKVTNVVLVECENITLDNFELRTLSPDLHEFVVERVSAFSVDFRLDGESKYEKREKGFNFVGAGYDRPFNYRANTSWWNAHIPAADGNAFARGRHPFAGALGVKELSPSLFRASYLCTSCFSVGDRFCVYDNRRTNNGIFVDRCKNLTFSRIAQRFNYALAFVAQTSENLTLDGLDFSPAQGGVRKMTSLADFLQFCMCKGQLVVRNSRFEGAGDDCLNVHGVHFSVQKIEGDEVTVSFRHGQTYGFNPLSVGDTVEFVNASSLAVTGSAQILGSRLLPDLHTLSLKLSSTSSLCVGDVLEDVTRCPDLLFENNVLTRIVTRGLLITTRGKVLVQGNDFQNLTMNAILVSNDAKSWYESGRVTDLTVRGNHFGRCPEYTLCVKPENGNKKVRVHSGILFEDNVIDSEKGGFYIKNAQNVTLRNNTFTKHPPVLVNVNSEIITE